MRRQWVVRKNRDREEEPHYRCERYSGCYRQEVKIMSCIFCQRTQRTQNTTREDQNLASRQLEELVCKSISALILGFSGYDSSMPSIPLILM